MALFPYKGRSVMAEPDELEEALVKVWAEQPNGEGSGERFWAKPLGNSLYEVRNIVMFVRGLHPLDIVRCEEAEGTLPKVVEMVRASGYKTIGIMFREDATEDQCVDALWALRKKGASYEKASRTHFAMAVPPESDYCDIVSFLQEQEEQGVLYFDELDKKEG
jgi:hypothetical protein